MTNRDSLRQSVTTAYGARTKRPRPVLPHRAGVLPQDRYPRKPIPWLPSTLARNTYLATEKATLAAAPAPEASALDTAPPPPWTPAEQPSSPLPVPERPRTEQAPKPTAVPHQRTPARAPDIAPAPPLDSEAGRSPAYLALARLGRDDHRLTLSADDCATLEPQAAQWLARGVSVDYLTSALTAGLPAKVDSPVGLLRRRLNDKIPPRLPTAVSPSPGAPASARRLLAECTECGRPGPPQALPDGLCRPCRTVHSGAAEDSPRPSEIAEVKAHMTNLRDLLNQSERDERLRARAAAGTREQRSTRSPYRGCTATGRSGS